MVRYLSSGGMGTIYEAVHIDLKKRVGVKALRSSIAENEEARARFLREGEAASRIRHPNVVDVFDVGVVHGTPYLVMELLEGEDLGTLLNREGPLPVPQITNVILPVIAAVATAHEMGVLHRDLKPENIFLAKLPHGLATPKLLDFGISKFVDTHEALGLTDGGNIMGTPMYMSPEQATKSKTIDARSDQYSIGVILYESVTNEEPFKGETLYHVLQAIVAGNFVPPSFHRSTLPRAFESIILRAMSTEPEFRYPDLPAMGRALLQFADERDRAIWSPAFEPARALGSPLNPSLPPEATPSAPPLPLTRPKQTPDKTTLSNAASERDAELKLPARTGLYWGVALGAALLAGLGILVVLRPFEGGFDPEKRGGAVVPDRPNTLEPAVAVQVEKPDKPTIYRIKVETEPVEAELELDGVKVGTGSLTVDLPRDGTFHVLRVSAAGYEAREVSFSDQPPPDHIALSRVEEEGEGAEKARTVSGRERRPTSSRTKVIPAGPSSLPSSGKAPSRRPMVLLKPEPEPPPPAARPAPPTEPSSSPGAPPVEFSTNKAPIIE